MSFRRIRHRSELPDAVSDIIHFVQNSGPQQVGRQRFCETPGRSAGDAMVNYSGPFGGGGGGEGTSSPGSTRPMLEAGEEAIDIPYLFLLTYF